MSRKKTPSPTPLSSRSGEEKPRGSTRGAERLQKVLAAAGLGSRRQCEELIKDGRVEVDGHVASLGMSADPIRQEIRVDGTRLPRPRRQYIALHKPSGVVCTNRDPAARTRVVDLVDADSRLFPVGRLDRASEGLILLTNDGDFANAVAHPRYGVEKTYRVLVAGDPTPASLQQLVKGVYLAEGIARVASIRVRRRHKQATELEVVLNEGKNREIRRVLARVGHKVMRLKRTAIGPLRLGDLPAGAYRPLRKQEVEALLSAARQQRRAARKGAPSPNGPTSKEPSLPRGKRRQGAVLTFEDEAWTGNERPRGHREAARRAQGKARQSRSQRPPAKARPVKSRPSAARPTRRRPRKGKRP